MKLFITNKKELDQLFPENTDCKSSKEIHQEAYKELLNSLNINSTIPLCLTPSYDQYGICLLDFVNKKEDIYFYTFISTAK